MAKKIDLVGQTFNRLTVVRESQVKRSTGVLWECSCQCGGSALVDSLKLRKGLTKSCGCHRKENVPNLKHGLANRSGTYRTWKEMRQRCTNPNATQWKWYGGRGIKICEEWDSYEKFLADMGDRPEGKTLDRINSDGDYEKSNCRWATAKEQAETNRGCFRKGQNRR